MQNTLKELIELQKIDSRLLDIEESKGDLPNVVKKLNEELNETINEEKISLDRIKNIISGSNKESAQIDDNSVKLGKLKEQLYLVKSNREYDALNSEIDHLKELINISEDMIIDLEEEKENLDEKNKSFVLDIEKIKEILKEKNTELNITLSNTKKEESDLNKSRIQITDKIENKFLFNYDKLREAKGGKGIVEMFSNACGECYTQLPKQTVIEVKENNDLISCPNCSIYLFFDKEVD